MIIGPFNLFAFLQESFMLINELNDLLLSGLSFMSD